MDSNSTQSETKSSSSVVDGTWIHWYTTMSGNEFLAHVPEEYIREKFNLIGLESQVVNYDQGIEIILDLSYDCEYGVGPIPLEADEECVLQLYGLIHARYITSPRGIQEMCNKYEKGIFGSCPRFYCNKQYVLPIGLDDNLGGGTVKLYCPSCRDIFEPRHKHAHLDGAYFGTGFPHLFFMILPNLRPEAPSKQYVPRLYGFKIAESSYMPLPPPKSPEKSPPKPAIKPPFRNIENVADV